MKTGNHEVRQDRHFSIPGADNHMMSWSETAPTCNSGLYLARSGEARAGGTCIAVVGGGDRGAFRGG